VRDIHSSRERGGGGGQNVLLLFETLKGETNRKQQLIRSRNIDIVMGKGYLPLTTKQGKKGKKILSLKKGRGGRGFRVS